MEWQAKHGPPVAVQRETKQRLAVLPSRLSPFDFWSASHDLPIHTPHTQGQVFRLAAGGVRVTGGSAGVCLSFPEQQANF